MHKLALGDFGGAVKVGDREQVQRLYAERARAADTSVVHAHRQVSGTMFMLAFQTKPGLRVTTRRCDVNGFHRSLEGDLLKLPVSSTRTAAILRWPSLSTAGK